MKRVYWLAVADRLAARTVLMVSMTVVAARTVGRVESGGALYSGVVEGHWGVVEIPEDVKVSAIVHAVSAMLTRVCLQLIGLGEVPPHPQSNRLPLRRFIVIAAVKHISRIDIATAARF